MIRNLLKSWVGLLGILFISLQSYSQNSQSCPININFGTGTLSHWQAYTGNNVFGNDPSGNINLSSIAVYDSTVSAPSGTIGAVNIPEFRLPSVNGLRVITQPGLDPFGGFSTIPTINGYKYNYSLVLGSTSITHSTGASAGGGYVRGVRYTINVPATPATQPYTMTYAYAMVLENGAHNSIDQPMARAIISTKDGIIDCASPKYFLPATDANARGGNAHLDTAAAIANGFSLSTTRSPNPDPNSYIPGIFLQDVWTKGWTEVTFDLSPYRGQQVTLTFEADNCVPGGHFSYAYIAIRNTCAGLQISGDTIACTNSNSKYSIPALDNATYQWSVPSDWVINSGNNSSIIDVTVGQQPGYIIAREQNSCANLVDTLDVTTKPPTIPGNVVSDAQVCTGNNITTLTLNNNRGNVIKWIYSTDGSTWNDINDSSSSYNAINLTKTTVFKPLVQNGYSCAIDSSSPATVTVFAKSVGGTIQPMDTNYCAGETINTLFNIKGNTGNVLNWQTSVDSILWTDINPPNTFTSYNVTSLITSTHYRAIVQNGVCPTDTSAVSNIYLFPTNYPQVSISPADTTICSGSSAPLNGLVTIGTNFEWANDQPYTGTEGGTLSSLPSNIRIIASPSKTSTYVLNIQNAGCPNTLSDSFQVVVIPPIIVNPGNDTSVVINQPIQFNASSNDTTEDIYQWSPTTYLNSANIPNPTGIYPAGVESITYQVRATDTYGCFGIAPITVKIFQTKPDIFVPNAFTPGMSSNNIFRPIPVGVSTLQYFKVYNRWGQLVYSTSKIGEGWNGSLGGKLQDAGTFVWMVQGTDYTGRIIAKKGTMVLVR